ncbi:MAG TPA: PIN domain protein [Planctomycetes bacterium]|jgi:hypothetical protein|nr:PIN domain protein [Planctomycetota bacterium]
MSVKRVRVYLDTSVIGGRFDAEFSAASSRFFAELADGRFIGVISDVVAREILHAPPEVRRLVEAPSRIPWEYVREDAESIALTDAYLAAGVVSAGFRDDCAHVALATVSRVDVLVSWNFRHIVHFDRIRGFNSVNLREGYGTIDIRSPLEVIAYGE